MNLTADQARTILAPYIDTLESCVTSGVGEYNDFYASQRHVHSPHSRAMLIRDHIVNQVRKNFDGLEGVKIVKKNGLFLLSIHNQLFLRFKKMNGRMLTRNLPTRQSCRFSEQLSFEGFYTSITNLNVGYIPNDVWTRPSKVIITCPDGIKSNKWYMDITASDVVVMANMSPVQNTVATENKRRVTAKVLKKDTGS